MRRRILLLISFAMVFSVIFSSCTKEDIGADETPITAEKLGSFQVYDKKVVDVDYTPTIVNPKVPSYTVEKGLANVVNIQQFGEFSPEQILLLENNGFVVNPTKEEQLFFIYEYNQYKELPSFITTDSVLHTYHIFYDYTLRILESEKLIGELEKLTKGMLARSIEIYDQLENPSVKEAQLKNIAFFGTAQLLLEKELMVGIPKEAEKLMREETNKIKQASGFQDSSIFPYELDYSQYTVRGHYTRSEDLARYFKTMMWYGQAPFPLYKDLEYTERNIDQTLQALLITYTVYSEKQLYEAWEGIYEPTNFFVGSSDDLDIYKYAEVFLKVYGGQPDLNRLEDKLDTFYREADLLPEPRIKPKYTSVTTPVGKQFRFMGQRYVLDAEIIQELVEPIVRPIPSGLDVIGVLGSERAREIQLEKEENKHWNKYPILLEQLTDRFSKLPEEKWKSNMYEGWMWTLKSFSNTFGEGYPSFMTNEAWVDKDLNTALGSWSELKHDTILYGKQVGAEMGGWMSPEVGYVEPNIQVYEKLLWLTRFSRENLKQRNLAVEGIDEKMVRFEELLEFLISCSIKELNNEPLTEDEYVQIGYYGGTLENITSSFAGDGVRWFEITSDTDKNMAVIADFYTAAPNEFSPGGYMESGVGPAQEIYVIVPIEGQLYLTRGAVFSYYEFLSEERLTDERWHEMIREDNTPLMPEWTNSFIRGGKGEVPNPIYDNY